MMECAIPSVSRNSCSEEMKWVSRWAIWCWMYIKTAAWFSYQVDVRVMRLAVGNLLNISLQIRMTDMTFLKCIVHDGGWTQDVDAPQEKEVL